MKVRTVRPFEGALGAEIAASVHVALEPLVSDGVVSDVRTLGIVGTKGMFKPSVYISITGERPEAHAGEISRLIYVAGLDVQWTIAADGKVS